MTKSRLAAAMNEDQNSSETTYQRMLTQLSNVEWNMTKSRLAAAMNEAELRNYEGLHQKVEEGIVSGRKEIENTKRDLVDAKRVRKNRMEYDALAKVIQTHPDRATTGDTIDNMQMELAELKQREQALEDKLDMRKKQFHVLVSTIHQLQSLLAEDEVEVANNVTSDTDKDTSQDTDMEIVIE